MTASTMGWMPSPAVAFPSHRVPVALPRPRHAAAGRMRRPGSASVVMRERQYRSVQPGPPPSLLGRVSATPWFITVPGLLLAVTLAVQVARRLVNRGSMSEVEGRGLINQDRNLQGDPFTDDVMKNMNTVIFEELTEEQIAAARKRRSRERDGKVDFEQIVLPDNHPFAVKKQVTPEEEELQRQRLAVRRGLPLQDLSGRRGFPGEEGFPFNQSQPATPQQKA